MRWRSIIRCVLVIALVLCVVENYLTWRRYPLSDEEDLKLMTFLYSPDNEDRSLARMGNLICQDPHISEEDPQVLEVTKSSYGRVDCPETYPKDLDYSKYKGLLKPPAPPRYPLAKKHKRVLLLGCSYSYGQGVADPKTFAYRLNESLPDIYVDNQACPGFSTYTSLVREEIALKEAATLGLKYDLVLYGFIVDHLLRNVRLGFTHAMESNIDVVLPRAEVVNGRLLGHDAYVMDWPGMCTFRTVSLLRSAFVIYRQNHTFGELEQVRVLNACFRKMQDVAGACGADFGVIGLEPVCSYIDPAMNSRVLATDIPFAPLYENPEKWRVGRYGHPNAGVHAFWAKQLEVWLNSYFAKKGA